MTDNRSLPWAPFLRASVAWALRQLLGLLAIVASLVLLVAVASFADTLSARLGWAAVATALGVLAWVAASLVALYALSQLLRLRRDRCVGLWLLLAAAYAAVVWAGGGFPLAPRVPDLPAPPVAAADRMLVVSDGLGTGPLPPSPAQLAAPATTTRIPAPTAAPAATAARTATAAPTAAPVAAPAPVAPAAALPLWGQSAERATLWDSPEAEADAFTTVPGGAYFRILGATDARYRVYYGGDRARRRPGEAWLDKESLTPSDWPQFVQVRRTTPLLDEPQPRARAVSTVPRGSYLEVVRGGPTDWARVLYLGDGRDGGPYAGWVTASDLVPTDVDPARIGRFAATAAALARQPEVWLKVPYVSQLDGSPWAAANCGPTSVAMLLEAHGVQAPSGDVRRQVMALQGTPNCHDCGAFIEHLAGAAERYGLRAVDLLGGDRRLRRWSLDDVRAALRAGHPVLPQVKYPQLPGREDSPYRGDHYIVVTGILGDDFLYNDPIDDGPGYGRLIPGERLRRAMAASDFPLAAFAAALP